MHFNYRVSFFLYVDVCIAIRLFPLCINVTFLGYFINCNIVIDLMYYSEPYHEYVRFYINKVFVVLIKKTCHSNWHDGVHLSLLYTYLEMHLKTNLFPFNKSGFFIIDLKETPFISWLSGFKRGYHIN